MNFRSKILAMAKKKVASNIQENHTLGEYQRYFSHLLGKGKLNRYSLNEKKKLDPNKQYWKITNEKGETYYYEVPKYIKPDSMKTAYSMNRVMHRRPARAALAIFVTTAALSFTSALVTKRIFVPYYPPVPPADLNEIQKKLLKYQNWAKEHPGEDVTKSSEFTVSDLSNAAMASALYDPSSYTEATGYIRRTMVAVGYGTTTTSTALGPVVVDISNAFIHKNGDALEESISFSSSIFAPQVGRRDFYTSNDNQVKSNQLLEATSSTVVTWSNKVDRTYSKDDYIDTVGKIPDSPFLYTINDSTVLEKSKMNKTSGGYEIKIDLDKVIGVANYIKRMKYLSGKDTSNFTQVDITLITDSNLLLKSFSVEEKYEVDSGITIIGKVPTTGALTTRYYYDNVPDIPEIDKSFDYSKYPK